MHINVLYIVRLSQYSYPLPVPFFFLVSALPTPSVCACCIPHYLSLGLFAMSTNERKKVETGSPIYPRLVCS